MQIRPPKFKILAMAPFHTTPERIWEGPPVAVERTSLDDAIAQLLIQHYLPLDGHLCSAGGLHINATTLKSLHPDGLVMEQPYLSALAEAGEAVETAYKKNRKPDDIRQMLRRWPDLPDVELPKQENIDEKKRATDRLDNLFNMIALPDQDQQPIAKTIPQNPYLPILQTILKNLFDDPHYRRMEAAWRGLRLLLQQGALEENVAIEIVPVHPQSLEQTIEALTPEILTDPPGLILLDLPFSNTPSSMSLLSAVTAWASNLMIPLATWSDVDFLQIERWEDLKKLPFLPTHLEQQSYAKFKTLKSSVDSQWLCLMCNRFLVRYPYGPQNTPRRISLEEKTPLWISPVWACGVLTAKSVSATGWPTQLCRRTHYAIEDLAFASQTSTACTEASPGGDRFEQLILAGLTPLMPENKRDRAYLHRAVTVNGASLAFQLLLSQITRFVLWCKDNLPDERDPDMLEVQLKLAFQVFSEQSTPQGFEAVEIKASLPDEENRIPLQISVTPSKHVLSSRQSIELSLYW